MTEDRFEAVIGLAKQRHGVEVVQFEAPDGSAGAIGTRPLADGGVGVFRLDDYTLRRPETPQLRVGMATIRSPGSLIAHVARFRTDDAALFADPDRAAPSITAVYDYHDRLNPIAPVDTAEPVEGGRGSAEPDEPARPRHCCHRAHYAAELSDEWLAWTKAADEPLSQPGFAELLEDRIGDVRVVPPHEAWPEYVREAMGLLDQRFASPSELLALSRELRVYLAGQVRHATTLQTGEASIAFVEEHKDAGGQPLKVPGAFAVGIPVFRFGPLVPVLVRLRYRIVSGVVAWRVMPYRPDLVFREAFDALARGVAEAVRLPLYLGTPES